MERKCSIEGCEKRHKGRSFCEMHLLRFRKYGDTSVVRVKQPRASELHPLCSIGDCGKPTVGRGWCRNHYVRWSRRGGDPAVDLPRGNFSTPVSSRTHMFEQTGPQDCWLWLGSVNRNGYGITGLKGRAQLAHRAIYMELVGPIPEGMTLDHLCGNYLCVNPHHLDPCSRKENMFRGGRPHFELRGRTARYF